MMRKKVQKLLLLFHREGKTFLLNEVVCTKKIHYRSNATSGRNKNIYHYFKESEVFGDLCGNITDVVEVFDRGEIGIVCQSHHKTHITHMLVCMFYDENIVLQISCQSNKFNLIWLVFAIRTSVNLFFRKWEIIAVLEFILGLWLLMYHYNKKTIKRQGRITT